MGTRLWAGVQCGVGAQEAGRCPLDDVRGQRSEATLSDKQGSGFGQKVTIILAPPWWGTLRL